MKNVAFKVQFTLLILLAVIGVISICSFAYDKATVWIPASGDSFTISSKNDQQPVLSMNDQGILVINIPKIHDQWKAEVKAKKTEPKKVKP